jgi:uncharacterized protein YdaU (DUF1376 family)
MTQLPHMPLAIDSYILKTTHLTLEQHGAYMLLLIAAWRVKGVPHLPDDDKILARILGVGAKKWLSLKPVVMSFWDLGADGWTQNRQLEVRLGVERRVNQKRDAANARWGHNSLENKGTGDSGAYPDAYAGNDASADANQNQTLSTKEITTPNGVVSETEVSNPIPAKKKSRNTYPEAFETAWRDYPTDGNMSKVKAFGAWAKLDPADRQRVVAAIPGFVAFCNKDKTYRPLHMVRFINERRFDNFTGEGRAKLTTVEDWQKRLGYARQQHTWSSSEWGPCPGDAGCLVPQELLQAGDGNGWAEWKKAG